MRKSARDADVISPTKADPRRTREGALLPPSEVGPVPTHPNASALEAALDFHLEERVRGLEPSATVAINDRSNELRRSGTRIFKLGLGQSPFPVPEPVVQALRDHAHEKDYLPARGLPALRQAVADWHVRRGIEAREEDVLIGPGSKELMFLLQLVHDGDLLLPSPSWVSYEPQARILGRPVHWLPTEAARGWKLDPEVLDAFCAAEPGRSRLLVLNTPANPTGAAYEPDELEAIARVARRHRLLLLSDEIYGEVHHRAEHVSIARFYPEATIVSSGLSKWCGAGGWRLGTFVFPRALDWLATAMAAVATETYTSTAAPIQWAAVRAFTGGPAIEDYLVRSRRILAALGSWAAARLRQAGVSVAEPAGGFYLFPDFSPLAERLRTHGVLGSRPLCERLLVETGVAALPGSDFGRQRTELTARIAYVDFEGAEALADAGPDVDLDEPWLRAHCPRVVEAIDRICAWVG